MKTGHVRFSPEWWECMTMPEPNSGCLLWMGSVCKSGYGRVAYSGNGSPVLIHRIAYECAFGPILDRRHVCHRCDTPSCVNPDHLFIGTQKDNMRDMFAKGRARPGGDASGKKAKLRLLRTVAAPEVMSGLALSNSNEDVVNRDLIHLLRTTAIVAGWRHVTGVPARRPTTAIVLWKRPETRTAEPVSHKGTGYQSAATLAGCCGPSRSPAICLSGTPSRRGTEDV